MVEQIEGVGAEVEQQSATCSSCVNAPGAARIEMPRSAVTVAHLGQPAQCRGVKEMLHLHKPGQAPPVVGDEQLLPRAGKRLDHAVAFRCVARHGLFDIGGFAGGCDAQRVVTVRFGRRGNVDGVDVGIAEQRVSVVVPARHAMAAGIVGGQRTLAPHDRDELRAGRLLEARAAFDLGDIATADDAPAHDRSSLHLRRKHDPEFAAKRAGCNSPRGPRNRNAPPLDPLGGKPRMDTNGHQLPEDDQSAAKERPDTE